MAPKKSSSAEKLKKKIRDAARYQRMKADPELAMLMQLKEQERYKKKKDNGQRKLVSQMTSREKRVARKKWKKDSKAYRQNKKNSQEVKISSDLPVMLQEDLTVEEVLSEESPQPSQPLPPPPSRQAVSGRKRVRKDRSKVARKNKKLQERINLLEKKVASQRQKIHRLQNSNTNSPGKVVKNLIRENNPKVVRQRLLFGEVLEREISDNVKNMKSHKAKREITDVIVGDGRRLRKYGLLHKCASFIPRRAFNKAIGSGSNSPNCSTMKIIHSRVKQDVGRFLEEDENSRCLPGKKDCISRGGVKKQKRLLLGDLKELHKKFIACCGYEVSYSTFCRFRPFWILVPDVIKRDTCLCQAHANFELRLEALRRCKVTKSSKVGVIKEQLCCVPPTIRCYHRKCSSCKNNHILYGEEGEFDGSQVVNLKQWTNTTVKYMDPKTKKIKETKRTVKLALEKPLTELIQETDGIVDKFLEHEGNIFHQYNAIKYLKEALKLDEVLIHCDFSENYATKYSSEIQAIHFGGNRQSVSLHTVVLYIKKECGLSSYCICTISENLDHGPGAIWAHLAPVFSFINSQISLVTSVYFLSDGPSNQYRNKTIFYLLQHRLCASFCHLKSAFWNYSEAGHGKGAPDGVGGTIKRTADMLVAQGNDITDVESLMKALLTKLDKVLLFKVESASIRRMTESLPQDISPFKGTMRVHQVIWRKGQNYLHMNALSCFVCRRRCKHHNIGSHVSRLSEEEENPDDGNYDEVFTDEHQQMVQKSNDGVPEADLELAVPLKPFYIAEGEARFIDSANADIFTGEDLMGPGIELDNNCNYERVQVTELEELINLTVLNGLCYHCGNSISSKKTGRKCEICMQKMFHEECKLIPSLSKDEHDLQQVICCKSCYDLLF